MEFTQLITNSILTPCAKVHIETFVDIKICKLKTTLNLRFAYDTSDGSDPNKKYQMKRN